MDTLLPKVPRLLSVIMWTFYLYLRIYIRTCFFLHLKYKFFLNVTCIIWQCYITMDFKDLPLFSAAPWMVLGTTEEICAVTLCSILVVPVKSISLLASRTASL